MPKVKVLSLNLHCLVEKNLKHKQQLIADYIKDKDIDIITFQEVAQTATLPIIEKTIKQDNYAYTIQQLLTTVQKRYYLIYVPIKHSFNKYDEGLAVLSKYPIDMIKTPLLSRVNDYHNWKKRMALITYIDELKMYVTTTHFGWTDEIEQWEDQLDQLMKGIPLEHTHVLTGDFNITPSSMEYKHLQKYQWHDVLEESDNLLQPTHINDMDIHKTTSKIDYIMSNTKLLLLDSDIAFINDRVSDHYGIYVELNV